MQFLDFTIFFYVYNTILNFDFTNFCIIIFQASITVTPVKEKKPRVSKKKKEQLEKEEKEKKIEERKKILGIFVEYIQDIMLSAYLVI